MASGEESGIGELLAEMLWEDQILTTIGDNMDDERLIALLADLITRIKRYSLDTFEKGPDGRLRRR